MSTFRLDRPVIDIRMVPTERENEYRIDLVEEGGKRNVTTIIFKLDAANDMVIKSGSARQIEAAPGTAKLNRTFKKVKDKTDVDTPRASATREAVE